MLSKDTRLISVDDHVMEPPATWVSRAPARFRDKAPKVVEQASGAHAWVYESQVVSIPRSYIKLREGAPVRPSQDVRFDEMRPGCYDSRARLADMDIDGVWAELCFPNFARFAGHRFFPTDDPELSRWCVEAYNDFILDEWCAADPDRYLPLIILPFWDIEASVQEARRTLAKGAKSIGFCENPTILGLPSIHTSHWNPLWEVVADAEIPLSLHFGSSSKLITSSDDAPIPVSYTLAGLNSMVSCADWLYSGIFDRYPKIRIALSEGGAGWVPYILEKAQKFYDEQGHRVRTTTSSPVDAFREHIYVCLVTDFFALRHIDEIGTDNVMFESDYPHADSEFPHSRKIFAEATAHLPADVTAKIANGNATRLFSI
jgi:predicted TIM-barrel fold metal-dependent hydrolase